MTSIKFNDECGKVMYPRLKDARTVLNRLKTYRGKHAVERIYKCRICECYHFTSAELDINRLPEGAYAEPRFAEQWQKLLNDSKTDSQEHIDEQGGMGPSL